MLKLFCLNLEDPELMAFLNGCPIFGARFDYYLLFIKSEAALTLTEPSFVLLKTSSMLIFFFSVSIDCLTLFDFWLNIGYLKTKGLLCD